MKNILMRLWRGRLRPALKRALRESALARLALRLAYRMVGVKVDKITPLPSGAALYTVGDMVLAMDGFRLPDPVRWEKVVLDIAAYGYRPGPGDYVLDIGAGFGEECIFFSRWVGPQGRVCAVEAIPANASVLAELARANGVTNLKILSLALGQTAGQIHLTESEFWESNTVGAPPSANLQPGQGVMVECLPFDLLVERSGLGRIDFLKCNIEGAERFLVDSGQQLQKIPELAIACHDFRVRATNDEFFRTRELVSAHLLRLGYKIRHQNTGIGYIDDWVYATRRT